MVEFRKRCDTGDHPAFSSLSDTMSELLRTRGIDTEEKAEAFLNPSLSMLEDPFRMRDMEKAVRLIREAVQRGDRICVYGDYDVDGVSAAAILTETLREVWTAERTEPASPEDRARDAERKIGYRIPKRHSEGYGLNIRAVEELSAEYEMLITVDCGISNVREVQLAKEKGMTVIVTDHHELPEELPEADAVLNPLLGDYPFRRLCGAGVALKIGQALQGGEGVLRRIEIAALATVADIVPLTGENRVIVREGMLRMAETKRPGLRALMEMAEAGYRKAKEPGGKPERRPVTSEDLAFRLGPRMNAAGRMEDADPCVRLLLTGDEKEGRELAGRLESSNRKRRAEEEKVLSEAASLFRAQVDLRKDRAIILFGENWNPGLIGLAAGKICERYHHPTVVLTRQADGENAVGSCRSVPGIHIYDALKQCGDLLVRFGGHAQAAGLTIAADRVGAFRERLNSVLRELQADAALVPVREYDAELRLKDADLALIDQLACLEPTGYGNPAPVFRVRNAYVQEARRVGAFLNHLKVRLLDGETLLDGIAFGQGDQADGIPDRVDVLFHPDRNEYMGRVTPQMKIEAIRPAEETDPDGDGNPAGKPGDLPMGLFLRVLQEMSLPVSKETECGSRGPDIWPPLPAECLLKERIKEIRFSLEELRDVYRRLREICGGGVRPASLPDLCGRMGLSERRLLTALTVFAERRLLSWKPEPFEVRLDPRPARCDIMENPLMRYLSRLPD